MRAPSTRPAEATIDRRGPSMRTSPTISVIGGHASAYCSVASCAFAANTNWPPFPAANGNCARSPASVSFASLDVPFTRARRSQSLTPCPASSGRYRYVLPRLTRDSCALMSTSPGLPARGRQLPAVVPAASPLANATSLNCKCDSLPSFCQATSPRSVSNAMGSAKSFGSVNDAARVSMCRRPSRSFASSFPARLLAPGMPSCAATANARNSVFTA